MSTRFDAIVIDTGQAAPPLAVRLASAGMQVAAIERKSFGGTCVNTGCMPTKALVASARAAFVARRSSEWGVTIDGAIHADMPKIKARKDAIVQSSSRGVEQWLRGTANCTVFEGQACLEGPRSVRVGRELLEAQRIFLNVGARAFVPALPGIDCVPYLTNSSMMTPTPHTRISDRG
jgi:pyruvate/2-oxoglutarate dehydrogenase complex dihydrolipoamide dehydrogenase (E3) component